MPECLTPECDREVTHRGLCKGCYSSAIYYIGIKKTSWDELVKQGLAWPVIRRGQHGGLFRKALDAKRKPPDE